MTIYGLENKTFEGSFPNFQNTTIQLEQEKTKNSNFLEKDSEIIPYIKFLIIDCSPIPFIDSVGVKTIKQVFLK